LHPTQGTTPSEQPDKPDKMNASLKIKIATAAVLGTLAFNSGMKCIPALDKELAPLFDGMKIGEGALPIMKAWLASWHAANLAA
jgi:hypothetical protein